MLFKQQKISKRKVDQINNFFFSFEKPNQQLYLFVLSKKKKTLFVRYYLYYYLRSFSCLDWIFYYSKIPLDMDKIEGQSSKIIFLTFKQPTTK